jgi:hypothetical protein
MNRALVKIVGTADRQGRVRLADFRHICDSLTACLNRVAEKAAVGPADFEITRLQIGSAIIEAGPAAHTHKAADATIGIFNETMRALQLDEPIDSFFDHDDIELFKKLAKPLGSTVGQMWCADVEITSDFVANLDRRLARPLSAIGEITGRLDRVNVHDTREFYIYPAIHRQAIRCTFGEAMVEQVRDALKQTVTVSGKMFYLPDAAYPHLVRTSAIEIHPDRGSLPTLLDIKGLAPDCTGGMPVLDYLRSIRNG